MVEKKRYLVACVSTSDAIERLKRMHLKMQMDFMDRNLKINRERLMIVSDKIEVYFVTATQFWSGVVNGYRFNGMTCSPHFKSRASAKVNEIYEMKLEQTIRTYGVNDADGILKMYVRG